MRWCRWPLPVRYQILFVIFLLAYGQHLIGSVLHFARHAAYMECEQMKLEHSTSGQITTAKTRNGTASAKEVELLYVCQWPKNAWVQINHASHYGQFVSVLPGGFVSDYFGVRWVLLSTMVIFSVANSMGVFLAPVNWVAFFSFRLLYGLAAGFMRPALWRYVVSWAPPLERCKFCSIVLAGHYVAFILNYFIWNIRNFHWHWKFHVLSIQVGLIVIPFFFLGSEKPSRCKRISELELLEIEEAQDGSVSDAKVVPPYRYLWTSSAIWAETIIQFGDFWGTYCLVDLTPRYIYEMISGGGGSQTQMLVGVIPYVCRAMAGIGFGVLGDLCVKQKWLKNTVTIKIMATFSHILPGLALMTVGTIRRLGVCTLVLMSVGTLNGAVVVSTLKSALDQAPNFTGTIVSLNLFFGQFATISAQFIKSFIMESLPDDKVVIKWTLNFFIGGGMILSTGLIFLFFASGEMHWWNNKRLVQYRKNQNEPSSLSKGRSKITSFANLPNTSSASRR